MTDSLPTRFNISRRGISIDYILCANCDTGVETSRHLFFSCRMAREVMKLITRWWNVPESDFDSYEEWLAWFENVRLPLKNKKMLEGVFYVLWWLLWWFRNKTIFEGKTPKNAMFFDDLKIVLSNEDKLNYLEQPFPPAPVAPAGQQVAPEILVAHTAWVKGSKEIAGLMLMTMDSKIQRNLENLHAYDMLKELKTLFAQQAKQELFQTMRDFHSCKQKEGQSVSSYVPKIKGYIDNLERLGHPVTLGLALHEQTLNLPKNNAPALHAIRAVRELLELL
ncbi:zinc finger, CCHC-type containing protein, partial [Tanacetum coccineum]